MRKAITAIAATALAAAGMVAPLAPAHAASENSAQILKGVGCFVIFGTPEGVVQGSAPDGFQRVVTKSGNVNAVCRVQQTSGPELTRAYTVNGGVCNTGAGQTNDVKILANPNGMIMLVCKIRADD